MLRYIHKVVPGFKAALTALSVAVFLSSCMAGTYLKTKETTPAEMKGTFTVFLYGCRYPDDIDNVAILAQEGTPYTFEIYAPDFEYKTVKGLPADEAFKEAQKFLTCSFHYRQSQLSKITDPEGNILGYELKPLYAPFEFGIADVHIITYSLKDGTVRVTIRLDPDVERTLNDGGDRDRESGGK